MCFHGKSIGFGPFPSGTLPFERLRPSISGFGRTSSPNRPAGFDGSFVADGRQTTPGYSNKFFARCMKVSGKPFKVESTNGLSQSPLDSCINQHRLAEDRVTWASTFGSPKQGTRKRGHNDSSTC